MTRSHSRQPSQRMLRVGELIRHALAEILTRGQVSSPALNGMSLTITRVDMTPDLKLATAYVMPLGGARAAEVEAELNRLAKPLRGEMGHAVTLKYTPALRFRIDSTFETAQRIEALLHSPRVRRDLTSEDDDLGQA